MLRMCQLLLVFDTVTRAHILRTQRHRRACWASAVPFGGRTSAEPGLGARFDAASAARCGRGLRGRGAAARRRVRPAARAGGLTADMIAGITMPLSRSIAWPAPSWLAALVRSPMMPPLLRARASARPATGHPGSGRCPSAGSSPIGAEIGTSPVAAGPRSRPASAPGPASVSAGGVGQSRRGQRRVWSAPAWSGRVTDARRRESRGGRQAGVGQTPVW